MIREKTKCSVENKFKKRLTSKIVVGCLLLGIGCYAVETKVNQQAVEDTLTQKVQSNSFKTEAVVLTGHILNENVNATIEKNIRKDENTKKEVKTQSYIVSRGGTPISQNDVRLLEKIVMAEAGAEPYKGQVAVANVVLNRVYSKKFPNTVKQVVFQKGQFTPARKGKINGEEPSKSVKKAVQQALNGVQVVPAGTVYFLDKNTAKDLTIPKTKKFVTRIGDHWFYK